MTAKIRQKKGLNRGVESPLVSQFFTCVESFVSYFRQIVIFLLLNTKYLILVITIFFAKYWLFGCITLGRCLWPGLRSSLYLLTTRKEMDWLTSSRLVYLRLGKTALNLITRHSSHGWIAYRQTHYTSRCWKPIRLQNCKWIFYL